MSAALELKNFIQERADQLINKGLSFGIEHEFFLFNGTKTASLNDSQLFLNEFSKRKGWKKYLDKNNLIDKVGYDEKNGYHALKYEYPPHMLEIAIGYSRNYEEFSNKTLLLLSEIEETANSIGLRVVHTPSIPNANIDKKSLKKMESKQLQLHYNRKKIAFDKNIYDENIYEFPSRIAATQIHIGGFNWIENDNFLEKVYIYEPIVNYLILSLFKSPQKTFKERWQGYNNLFDDFKLFGFPGKDKWGFDLWKKELLLEFKSKGKDQNIIEFINNSRDLQLIRPKTYGTLEFRSTPGLDNIKNFDYLCRIRIAQCLCAENSEFKPFSYKESKHIWNDIFASPEKYKKQIDDFITYANQQLIIKGFKEI